jgi:hypothetical protein
LPPVSSFSPRAEDALRQLSLRFGHMRGSRAGVLDAVFLWYESEAEGQKPFRSWIEHDYDEDKLKQKFRVDGLTSFLNDRVLMRE